MIGLKIEGLDQLKRQLRQTPDLIRNRVAGVIATSTHAVTSRIRHSAPVRSGQLRSSIYSDVKGLRGRVFIGAYYWRFLEFGTLHIGAQPFVRPAVELEAGAFEQALRQVDKAVERDFAAGWAA